MKVKELISRINLPARASMAYLGASLIGKAIGILTTPFFTRLISEEEYGALTLYMTLLGGGSVICSAVSSGSAIYRGFKVFENERESFARSALSLSLSFSALISLILLTLLPLTSLSRAFYLPLALQIICDGVIGVSMAEARFNYKYLRVGAVSIISSALPAGLSLLFLRKFGCGCGVRIYSLLLVSLSLAFFIVARLLLRGGRTEGKMIKHLLKSSLPLLPHSLSVALSGQADKLFITSLMGAAALAKYSVVHSLGIALQFAVTALGSAFGPWMIRRLDKGEKERIGSAVSKIFLLFLAVSLGLCGIAPEAMRLLAPDKYSEALPALIPIALSTPLALLSYVVTVGLVHSERGKATAAVSVINLLFCVTFNYTLIPKLGYLGAGLALLLSQVGAVAVGVVFLSRAGNREMIPLGRSMRYFLLALLVGGLLFFLYDRADARLLLMTIPLFLGIKGAFGCIGLIKEK